MPQVSDVKTAQDVFLGAVLRGLGGARQEFFFGSQLVILVESWDSFGRLVKLFQCGGDIVWLSLGVDINHTGSAQCVKNVRDALTNIPPLLMYVCVISTFVLQVRGRKTSKCQRFRCW